MSFIDQIKKPILTDLQLFNNAFSTELSTDNELLKSVYEYTLKRSGKQLRPILTLLAAKICGEINRNSILAAQSLELLHTASLVHDDVVDDTFERRGNPSVNARWTNKTAVFAGDYLFSKSLDCATQTNNLSILRAVSEIGRQLTDGELLQLVNTQLSKTTEENYYTIIKKKTAQLFSSCTEVGGLSAHASEIQLTALKNYGEYLGISFQIKDDIFDYFDSIQIGKPTGNDLRDGKVTLPLIYALEHASEAEKTMISRVIDSKDFTIENIKLITQFTVRNGGIDYATKLMEKFKNKAIEELSIFEDGEIKQSLILCAEYAAFREF